MSKKSNIHPGHDQTEGRSRPGDDLLQDLETQSMRSRSGISPSAPPRRHGRPSPVEHHGTRRTADVPTTS